MKILISNRQNACKLDTSRIRKLALLLMSHLRRLTGNKAWAEISLVFVNDTLIRRINKSYFRDPGVTDVISFRYTPLPGQGSAWSGEVIVNVEQALRARPGSRREQSRELALYLAHGCDHLSGATDAARAGYMRMRRRELRWLRQRPSSGYADNLITSIRKTRGKARQDDRISC